MGLQIYSNRNFKSEIFHRELAEKAKTSTEKALSYLNENLRYVSSQDMGTLQSLLEVEKKYNDPSVADELNALFEKITNFAFSDIIKEIFEGIALQLSTKDLFSLKFTCVRFYRLGSNPFFLRHFFENTPYTMHAKEMFAIAIKIGALLIDFDLSKTRGINQVNDKDVLQLIKNCSNIKFLNLSSSKISPKAIKTVLESLKHLESFSIKRFSSKTSENFTNVPLKMLKMKKSRLPESLLEQLMNNMTELQELDMRDCRLLKPERKKAVQVYERFHTFVFGKPTVKMPAFYSLKNLHSLALSGVDDFRMKLLIQHFPKLRELKIPNHSLSLEMIKKMSVLQELELLDVQGKCDNDGLQCIATQFTRLHTLNLSNASVDNNGIVHVTALKNLKSLEFCHGSRLMDEGLNVLTQYLTQLEVLTLDDGLGLSISRTSIDTISQLKNLRVLNLNSTTADNQNLNNILSSATKLEHLFANMVTDLDFQNVGRLKSLSMDSSATMTTEVIAEKFSLLEFLSLKKTSTKEIKAISQHCRRLRTLILATSDFTEDVLESLDNLENLQSLKLVVLFAENKNQASRNRDEETKSFVLHFKKLTTFALERVFLSPECVSFLQTSYPQLTLICHEHYKFYALYWGKI